jgi:YndJ-like protein
VTPPSCASCSAEERARSLTITAAIALCAPLALVAIGVGITLLRRAFARRELLPEEFALAGAWVFLVGSVLWLGVFLSDSSLLGFYAPWTWLTASHFAAAGFGALTVTALACRTVANARARRVLRVLLVVHPVVYLITAIPIAVSWERPVTPCSSACSWRPSSSGSQFVLRVARSACSSLP